VLQGFGNLEDNVLHFPEGSVRALALRSFDTSTQTWAIWWLDDRSPHRLDVPVKGNFNGHVGTFFAEVTLAGRPIKVRFTWRTNLGAHPT
jgi:hypothetical protein